MKSAKKWRGCAVGAKNEDGFFSENSVNFIENQHLIETLKKIEKFVKIFSKSFEISEIILKISENGGQFLEILRNFF